MTQYAVYLDGQQVTGAFDDIEEAHGAAAELLSELSYSYEQGGYEQNLYEVGIANPESKSANEHELGGPLKDGAGYWVNDHNRKHFFPGGASNIVMGRRG